MEEIGMIPCAQSRAFLPPEGKVLDRLGKTCCKMLQRVKTA